VESIKGMEDKLGPVDVLINCAGVSHAQIFEVSYLERNSLLML